MSRSCYSEDFGSDFPGQMELYRSNVDRSLKSKAGQARLRELREALLALPVKALEPDAFVEDTAHVCALGAWALAKTGDAARAQAMVSRDANDGETADALKPYGWPRLVVMETVYMNEARVRETPEQRYSRVLLWVEEQLA